MESDFRSAIIVKTSENLKIKLPPVTDQNGNVISDEELAQWEQVENLEEPGSLAGYVRVDCETGERYEAASYEELETVRKGLAAQMKQMRRFGQMSLQEWGAPFYGFDGFTAILCELNPDFDLKQAKTLGDFRKAATAAVVNATNRRTHPQHEKLRQIYKDFQAQNKEQKDVDELWYQWDVALQATAKYRPSALDKVEFYESRPQYTLREFVEWLQKLNERKAREAKQKQPSNKSEVFAFHASQEMDLWHRAQCNGKTFTGYMVNIQAGAIVFERKNAPHQIRLALTEDERAAGLAMTYLENLVRNQDADAVLATAYILSVLAPPPHLPARLYAGGWIDFDDAIKKIGWYPQTTVERREMHARIWEYVKFGERAHIIGKRTIPYKDPTTDKEIDTTIHGAVWRVMKTETPDHLGLYEALEAPVRAEIVVSAELTALLTNPDTAQYFTGAEILGATPGAQPSGAWARVIGAALLSFWRRNPREQSAGLLKPTRRELLDHFAAKIAPYEEILAGNDPQRAIKYWCGALQLLADDGFIERIGEAAINAKQMRDGLPPKGWKDIWLDQIVNIEVGAKMKEAFTARVKALPALKPRDLKTKPRAAKQRRIQ